MQLILWRHAEAEPGEPDFGRRLTPKGVKQADRVGDWLDHHLPKQCTILASPAERAQQTARALGRSFRTVEDLAPGASPHALLAASNWPESSHPVLIVGHQPALGNLIALLLTGEEAPWSVRKSAVWWLATREKPVEPMVTVRCVVAPDFL